MAFFHFNTIIDRVMPRFLILVVLFGVGCVPLKTQGPESSDSLIKNETRALTNQIHAVRVKSTNQQVTVRIETDQKPVYTAIKQDFPLGITIYLPDTRLVPNLQLSQPDEGPVQEIRAGYADQENTTAKIEILLNQDLPYEVTALDNDLEVVFPKTQPKLAGNMISAELVTAAKETSSALDAEQPDKSESVGFQSVAMVTGIEFNTRDTGHADIQVTTTQPVRYDTIWQSDTQLDLILLNTRIPERYQRALLPQGFKAAVDRVLPQPDSANIPDATIELTLREKVPYRIVQDKNLVSIEFEPSNMPASASKKILKPVNEVDAQARPEQENNPVSSEVQPESIVALQTSFNSLDYLPNKHQPRYSGEKIQLDFFETDIKNVFRILKSVSGMNFAVDDNVEGKVTLSMENPIPWDQVLDLVLKMNGLGRVMEGDVVRIATLATLKQENKDIQDALTAQKEAMEQRKSLEPLITKYISLSYADADEMAKHISDHMVSDKSEKVDIHARGGVTIDTRTNTLVVTATQAQLNQIEEIVNWLDTVTSQVMIEAKIVEVTKEFSRSLGLGLNFSNDASVTSSFVDDTNISVNIPSGSGGIKGDFSFFNLFGSSTMALNAKLSASEARGDIRVVSSPRILTLDNKEAAINQGLQYPYQVVIDNEISTDFLDINLTLKVTPHVTADGRILMDVLVTKNEIGGYAVTGEPYLNTNAAQTKLLVNDNDTVVIGGVVKTTNTLDKKGLPFLTRIPIVGNILLGNKIEEDKRNELLIFLTPSIVQLDQVKYPTVDTK